MTREEINKMEENLKKEISQNLIRIMKEKGFTQVRLSEESKIPKSTISDYIRRNTLANPGNIQKMADVLKVSKGDIDPSFRPQNDDAVAESPVFYETVNKDFSNITNIPIVGTIAAGTPVLAEENIEGYMPVLSSTIDRYKQYFYLIVKGNSMNLEFQEGSYVLVEKTNQIENGQIGVALINDEATVKKIYINNNIMNLVPASNDPNYQPQIFDLTKDNVKIIGKVVQAVKVY
ncbi:repressor LexA [Pullulanibacillus pueri]|uniref:LexA family transcriptional regulator n=1 Tax=Pullulanibacillus pueri TaxID=1437324 RepID=A0A8J3EN79_9BACL|nr:LexA family transcriptional regulator [Pullulanibacillus pueri]MBM7681986.1 repressor LexA [Pullulanibacillus pueri]GGH83668.1 LexA family transcriptional regulator [Pullulanibacillus pueri]